MATLSIRALQEHKKYVKPKRTNLGASYSTLKKAQMAELKQGLTEAILISRGEMKGTPLSELWDE